MTIDPSLSVDADLLQEKASDAEPASGAELAVPTATVVPWRRKDLKRDSRTILRTNAVVCALVSLISAMVIWPMMMPSTLITTSYDFLSSLFTALHWTDASRILDDVRTMVLNLQHNTSVGSDSSAGVISNMYNTVKSAGSIEKALVYAINGILLRNSLSASVIAGLTGLLSIAMFLFVRIPVSISTRRFFLETRLYPATPLTRLLFVYRRRRTLKIAVASVYKGIWFVLWGLTIVMLPVKYYSYLMYEYILAENPDANPREALRLSKEMMHGQKWKAFLLDCSFLGWYFLGLITFGIVSYFYAMPYHSTARADLYMNLRQQAIAVAGQDVALFSDPCLAEVPQFEEDDDIDASDAEVLVGLYPGSYPARGDRFHWERDYSLINLVLMFFLFSFIGWLYESTLEIAYIGHFVNRGTMYGPWLPIYGTGGVICLIVLRKLRPHPLLTFVASMVLCGIVEYTSATLIYVTTGLEYWSYAGYFFNIQGRVCLEGLLVFGLGCVGVIYLIAPVVDTYLNRIPVKIRRAAVVTLAVLFITDVVLSHIYPRTGAGLTDHF